MGVLKHERKNRVTPDGDLQIINILLTAGGDAALMLASDAFMI